MFGASTKYGYIFAQMNDQKWSDIFFAYQPGEHIIKCVREDGDDYTEIEVMRLNLFQFHWLAEDGGITVVDPNIWEYMVKEIGDSLVQELNTKRVNAKQYQNLSVANLLMRLNSMSPDDLFA